MVLDLKQIFDITGEKQSFDYSLDLSDYPFYGAKPFVTPVHIVGEVQNRAGVVYVSYTAQFTLKLACDRCLCEFFRDYEKSFSEVVVQDENTDHDEYAVAPDSMLDMDALAVSDIVLDLPSKQLCSEDCKGLCPVCGKDLNHETCQCQQQKIDPRLKVLGDLLK